MAASKKHIELIVSKQIFLKSIFYKINLDNPTVFKISSNGLHISARSYSAYLMRPEPLEEIFMVGEFSKLLL